MKPLPCPCCGSTTIHVSVADQSVKMPDKVCCLTCGLETGEESYVQGSALAAWNRRTTVSPLSDSVSLLKEAVKIVHAHSRNLNKDWLQRARAFLASCR